MELVEIVLITMIFLGSEIEVLFGLAVLLEGRLWLAHGKELLRFSRGLNRTQTRWEAMNTVFCLEIFSFLHKKSQLVV